MNRSQDNIGGGEGTLYQGGAPSTNVNHEAPFTSADAKMNTSICYSTGNLGNNAVHGQDMPEYCLLAIGREGGGGVDRGAPLGVLVDDPS